jgi:hypothetical protein
MDVLQAGHLDRSASIQRLSWRERTMSKPWFLRAKRLGDYSHLMRDDFNELRETVSNAVKDFSISDWQSIKLAALIALAELAKKHRCTFKLNAEGGHICIYKSADPVFALRIGSYARHRVEDLLKGKALYRGIIDIVPTVSLPLPRDMECERHLREMMQSVEPLKVLYCLLPTRQAGKWKEKEAIDMIDVIGCVKEHPGCSGRYIQLVLNMSPNKTVRLLDLLGRRRTLHRRGASKRSGWYVNER